MKNFSVLLLRNRFLFMALWLIIIIVSSFNLILNKSPFESGIGSIENSISGEVEQAIQESFNRSFSSNLIITLSDDNEINQELLKELTTILEKEKYINSVISSLNLPLPGIYSKDNKTALLLVQLKDENFSFAEKKVPEIRALLSEFAGKNHIELLLTGNAAFSYDMNILSEQQGQEAEKRIFIITLIVLIFAFRSVSAALIAVISGFIASSAAISLLKIITGLYPLSVFSQSISTMLGLALGIDYSLLLITRFRKELKEKNPDKAIITTVMTSGKAIIFSGFSVIIGLSALFIPDLRLSASIATGGIIVVLLSMLTALTFTPVLLYSAFKTLDFPKFLSGFVFKNRIAANRKWITLVVKHSRMSFLLSLIFLLVLSYPLLNLKLAEPDIRTMPDSMETKQGFVRLQEISEADLMLPVQLLVTARTGLITEPENMVKLSRLTADLKQKEVTGKVYSYSEIQTLTEFMDIFYPFGNRQNYKDFFISRDTKSSLIQLFPVKGTGTYELNRLITELRALDYEGLIIKTGGPATLSYDLIERLYSKFPLIIGLVFLATFILLAFAFKSILIPIKAIIANTLSILASYGILVMVFQYGWLSGLINLQYVPGAVLSGIPVLLFCIMFSLSMDYEVFLLSRIQEVYLETGDNTEAVITGISEIGEVITKAALVMLIVFGAFIQADIILIKMLGVGLFSAVLIDATLVRLVMVPAFMKIAGKANWYQPFSRS